MHYTPCELLGRQYSWSVRTKIPESVQLELRREVLVNGCSPFSNPKASVAEESREPEAGLESKVSETKMKRMSR